MRSLTRRRFLTACAVSSLIVAAPHLADAWTHGNAYPLPTGRGQMGMANNFGFNSYPFMNFFKGLIQPSGLPCDAGNNLAVDSKGYLTFDLGRNFQLGNVCLPLDNVSTYVIEWTGPWAINPQAGLLNITAGMGFVTGVNHNLFSGTDGHVEFNFTELAITDPNQNGPTPTFVCPGGFTFSGNNNAIFCRLSDYAALKAAIAANDLAGQMLPEYMAEMRALNMKTLRFDGWNDVNDICNFSHFAYRAPVDAFSYADRWETKAWVKTVSGTNNYSCGPSADMPGALQPLIPFQGVITNSNTNAAINCTFTNGVATIAATGSNFTAGQLLLFNGNSLPPNIASSPFYWVIATGLTANTFQISTVAGGSALVPSATTSGTVTPSPTISYNGGAAIPLVYVYPNNPQLTSGVIPANSPSTFVLDPDLNVVMVSLGGGLTCGVPLEVSIAVSNRLRSNLWFNYSHTFSDASITALINLAKSPTIGLSKNLALYPEYSNEMWNQCFSQTQYAKLKGVALGLITPGGVGLWENWYSLRTAQVHALAGTLWTGTGALLKRVIATQSVADPSTIQMYRLNGANVGAPHNAYPNRAVDLSEVFGIANYEAGGVCVPADINYIDPSVGPFLGPLISAAQAFAAGGSGIATGLNFIDNDIRAGAPNGVLGSTTLLYYFQNIYPVWETVMASYDGVRAVPLSGEMYEGALSINWPSASTLTTLGYSNPTLTSTQIKNLILAYKNDQRVIQLVLDSYSQLLSFSHWKTPSWLVSESPFFSVWTLHNNGDLFSPKFKTFDANVQFNN